MQSIILIGKYKIDLFHKWYVKLRGVKYEHIKERKLEEFQRLTGVKPSVFE